MFKKFKKQIKKINEWLENGIYVVAINNDNIELSNNMIIEYDNNGEFGYYYYHYKNGYRNYGFYETETITLKSLSYFIDEIMWKMFHVETV